jgi:hypothetical protein
MIIRLFQVNDDQIYKDHPLNLIKSINDFNLLLL